MRSTAGATLILFGIVLGFAWAGGCSDDHTSQAAPPAVSTGTPFFCYVGAPSASSSVWSLSGGGGAGGELSTMMSAPRDGTLKNLYVASTAAFSSGSVTIVVRKNQVDTGLLIVYGTADGTTVKSNTADTVSVAQGDLISIEFRETAGGSPSSILRASLLYE